jgi:hypothetical protein
MAEHKSRVVVLDGKFVRQEASQAVRTFSDRPLAGQGGDAQPLAWKRAI